MWTIYFKELRELLRDRKTMIFTIIIPIVAIPGLFAAFTMFAASSSKDAMEAPLKYALFGAANAPALSERFAHARGFNLVKLDSEAEINAAIANDEIKLALVIPPGFDEALVKREKAKLALYFNSASSGLITKRRVGAVVDEYEASVRGRVLGILHLDKTELDFALDPVNIVEHSTADDREQVGAMVGGVVPYFLLIVCLMAAMYPAIDLGAGEKERGTLETLLLAPVSRGQMVFAKFMVLFTVGLMAAMLMVASLSVLLGVFAGLLDPKVVAFTAAVSAGDLLLVALMLVPMAAIFAAMLLTMSIYAKNYKEAAGMMQPVAMLVLLPVMLAVVPGVELNWAWAAVPVTNVALAMKELVKGTMDYRLMSVILLSSTLIAGAMLACCRWFFDQEEVLFRD